MSNQLEHNSGKYEANKNKMEMNYQNIAILNMGNNECFQSGCLNKRIPDLLPNNYLYNNQRQNYFNHHQDHLQEVKIIQRKPKKANFGFFQVYSISHNGKKEILEDILLKNNNIINEQSFQKIIKEITAQSPSQNNQKERMVSNNDVQFIKTQSILVCPPNTEKNEKRRSSAFSIALIANEDLSGMVLPSNTIKKTKKQEPVISAIELPPRCASNNGKKGQARYERTNKLVKTEN